MKLGVHLADCALRYPDKEAVVCGERRITFAELAERANRLANALTARGQAYGDRIALYLPNSAELVEAIAGVALSGGVIVPISTRLAVGEVRFIFSDSAPRFIFFAPQFRRQAYEAAADLDDPAMIAVGEAEPGETAFEALIASGDPAPPPRLPDEVEDLVIGYTSGTTGNPKGAIGTHRSLVLLHGYLNPAEMGITRDERTLVTTPMAHRTGLGRVACAFCTGSTVVVMPRFDAAEAVSVIERERVTFIGGVPTVFRMLMPEIEKRPEACRSLRAVGATGETFPVPLKERLFAVLPDLEIYSFYAQTESGFIACLRPEEQRSHGASIGRPVPGVEIRIVDENLADVPLGEPGEVLVRCGLPGDAMIMRSYYNNPQATAETIVQGSWLRTGDVCRMDADGYLYFVDRAKDMIVSGGLNIYSKEVEIALAAHPAVADAAVIGVPDAEFGESVMAFVECEDSAAVSATDLIEHCRNTIASYKKPKHVRFVEELPRTSTGKVRKQDLRALAASEPESAQAGG